MFPTILRQLRKREKINQSALADAIGMSQATIASWEKGTRKPDADTVSRLADYFGVTIDFLMGRENQPEQTETAQTGFPHDRQDRAEGIALLGSLNQEELEKAVAFMKFQISQRKE